VSVDRAHSSYRVSPKGEQLTAGRSGQRPPGLPDGRPVTAAVQTPDKAPAPSPRGEAARGAAARGEAAAPPQWKAAARGAASPCRGRSQGRGGLWTGARGANSLRPGRVARLRKGCDPQPPPPPTPPPPKPTTHPPTPPQPEPGTKGGRAARRNAGRWPTPGRRARGPEAVRRFPERKDAVAAGVQPASTKLACDRIRRPRRQPTSCGPAGGG